MTLITGAIVARSVHQFRDYRHLVASVERARSPGVLAEKTDSTSSYYDSRLCHFVRALYGHIPVSDYAALFHHYNKPSPTPYINRYTQTCATQRSPNAHHLVLHLPFHNGPLSCTSFSRSPGSLPRHVRLHTNVYPRIHSPLPTERAQ